MNPDSKSSNWMRLFGVFGFIAFFTACFTILYSIVFMFAIDSTVGSSFIEGLHPVLWNVGLFGSLMCVLSIVWFATVQHDRDKLETVNVVSLEDLLESRSN